MRNSYSISVEEDADRSVDELLDWLCWMWATDAERFHPANETADECMVAHYGEDEEEWDPRIHGLERGQHGRAVSTAVERFKALEQRGFDPKARAQREIERSRKEGVELDDIDWTWYDESPRLGDADE